MTSIFRAETSAKRYTWDKQSISYMHLRFSFFRIWAIIIRSRENHVFPRLWPRIAQQRKKENFWDFFPMNISEISVSSAQFQVDSWKSLLNFNLHWLPLQNTMTLYNFALKQSSALIFAPGIYLSDIGCLYKILWPFITLHSNNLLRWFLPQAFTCLNTINGVNMGVIGRCTSEQ